MNTYSQGKFQANSLRGNIPSAYIQDTFHATKRLTLVGGIRWEPNLMPVDYFNRGAVFDMKSFLAGHVSKVYPNAPAGLFYYGDQNVPRQFTKGSPWQWSPNVGATWDPVGNGKTVLRAGFEVAYDQVDYFTQNRLQDNPPFGYGVSFTPPSTNQEICFSEPWLANGSTASGYGCNQTGGVDTDPFPIPQIPPANAAFVPQTSLGVFSSQYHSAETTQWTASIQRELGHGWQAQLIYIGSKSTHEPIGIALDPATYIPGVWGAGGTGCQGVITMSIQPTTAVTPGAAGTNCSTTGSSRGRYVLVRTNPAYGDYIQGGGQSLLLTDTAYSNYNGMVASLQHRLSSTFSVLTNYTWSRCMDIADGNGDAANDLQDPTNLNGDYGRCGSDYRNIFNLTMVLKSNFPLRGLARDLANNWEFAPLIHIQSGAPFNITDGTDYSLTGVGNDRPNLVSGVNTHQYVKILSDTQPGTSATAATRQFLNPAAFAPVVAPCETTPGSITTYVATGCASNGQFGNLQRNLLSGPMYFQFDAQVSRIFPIREKVNLDVRLEAFNVLNHPDFSNPNATLSSSTFGQISGTANGARVFQAAAKIIF